MDNAQKLNLIHAAMTDREIPNRVLQYYKIEDEYDRMILARVDAIKRDRAILYDKDIPNVINAMEKSMVKKVSSDLGNMIDDIQKSINKK